MAAVTVRPNQAFQDGCPSNRTFASDGNCAAALASGAAAAGTGNGAGSPAVSIELQKRHLIAASWISSAQKGHFFMRPRVYTPAATQTVARERIAFFRSGPSDRPSR